MVHEVVDGTFRQTNLTNESSEYLAKRDALRIAEIELMRQRERVAELRRHPGEDGIRFLLVSGKPLEEPVSWYGPIVMNTQEQLQQAFTELREGTFLKNAER
jgi:redox-sensitive bicupin YhaK (pirin superfamily)